MLGETRTLNFGKEKISLNLEQGNVEERNNRTVAMSSLSEERKLPKKRRKDYNKRGGTQLLQSSIKKTEQKCVCERGSKIGNGVGIGNWR